MAMIFLGLGSNLGDKTNNLNTAIQDISSRIGPVMGRSGFIETEPWGYVTDNTYLNAVICVDTNLSPMELLHETQQIERDMGRLKKTEGEYQDRIIDIDILLYEDIIYNSPELTIPHPRMKQRDFVMVPLRQVMKNLGLQSSI